MLKYIIMSILYLYASRWPSSTGIFFARIQIFRSKFAHSLKRDYRSKSSLRKFFTNINSTTDFYILCKRWGIATSVQNFLSHSTKKFRWGTIRCIRKFRVSKNFMHQRGGITILRWKLFVTQYQKISLRNTWVFEKLSRIAEIHALKRDITKLR